MNSFVIVLIAFACVFGGALLGMRLGKALPADHLDANSKDVVRLGMGIVATMVALVLGLLIASAKGFYDTQNAELTQMSANVVLLDQMLAHYGPETARDRALLRGAMVATLDQMWSSEPGLEAALPRNTGTQELFDRLEQLDPKTEEQRLLKSQVLGIGVAVAQMRWLLYEQRAAPIPMPLLIALIVWLTVVFISAGLFAQPNPTVIASFFVAALSVAAAMWLIMEMYQPYGGMIQVSSAPVRAALMQLGR